MMNARLEELRIRFQENPRRYFAPYANELRKSGDPAQAIAVCRTHLASQPGHVSGHIVLGQALYEAGESAEARDVFTAALELDPENLIALRTLGEIAQVSGDFPTARQWYERLLDADPRNGEVAQLLKDMPVAAAIATAPPSLPVEAPALPDGATPPAEEPVPAPTFHTSFTGSGPAYQSDEPDADGRDGEPEVSATGPAAAAESVEANAVSSQSPEHASELDVVDFEAFSTGPGPAPANGAPASSVSASSEVPDENFAVEFPEPVSIAEQPPQAASLDDEVTEPDEPGVASEPPRAMFAERGFDGPAEDDYSWMTTPSAALSDLESAPEDWFDEAPSDEAAPAVDSEAEVQQHAADRSTDSWFDDVESAATVEATDVTPGELWLPPDLSSAGAPGDSANLEAVAESQGEDAAMAGIAATSPDPVGQAEGSETSPIAEQVDAASEAEAAAGAPAYFAPFAGPPAEDVVADEPAATEAPLDYAEATAGADYNEPRLRSDAAVDVTAESREVPYESNRDSLEAVDTPQESVGSTASAVDVPFEPIEPAASGAEFHRDPGLDAERSEPVHAADAAFHHDATVAEAPTTPPADQIADAAPPPLEAAVVDVVDHVTTEPSAQPPAPFITETLAELYLQQGFREEALAIYRQLAERNPSDEALQNRIATLERPAEPPQTARDHADAHPADSQSVRSFFSRLARRHVAQHPGSESAAAASPAAGPDVPFAAAASALANLFAASRPSATDESAAATLGNAFAEPSGRPSRAAERELSLDHLFRDVAAGETHAEPMTLDEFYAPPGASSGSPTEPADAQAPESGGTDIRQFTAWLEGLRKK